MLLTMLSFSSCNTFYKIILISYTNMISSILVLAISVQILGILRKMISKIHLGLTSRLTLRVHCMMQEWTGDKNDSRRFFLIHLHSKTKSSSKLVGQMLFTEYKGRPQEVQCNRKETPYRAASVDSTVQYKDELLSWRPATAIGWPFCQLNWLWLVSEGWNTICDCRSASAEGVCLRSSCKRGLPIFVWYLINWFWYLTYFIFPGT